VVVGSEGEVGCFGFAEWLVGEDLYAAHQVRDGDVEPVRACALIASELYG
jgi:hypothetical protein